MWDEHGGVYAAAGLDLLAIRGNKVAEVVSFLDAGIFGTFGLPDEIDD